MNPLDDTILNALLNNNGTNVYVTESDTVEFKSVLDWNNKEQRAKYSKSFAAFCNNKGGYLVFGINDKTKEIVGITGFDSVDSASIADHLNNYFSPSLVFQKRKIPLAGKEIGVIYIEQRKLIPTICIKSYGDILRDGALFYRYPGKSDVISGTDLIHLFHQIKQESPNELVDLKKQEMKNNALPILSLIGGGRHQTNFSFTLENSGERARVISVSPKKGNINLIGNNLPAWIEKGGSIKLQGVTSDGAPANFASFEIEILFQDKLETKYSITYSKEFNETVLSEPVEI